MATAFQEYLSSQKAHLIERTIPFGHLIISEHNMKKEEVII